MAARFLRACAVFSQSQDVRGTDCPRTKVGLRCIREAVEEEFDQDTDYLRRPRVAHTANEKRLWRQVQYRNRQLNKLKKQVARLRGEKEGGAVTTEVFVRVALSDPVVNSRKLCELLRAGECEQAPLSHSYIGRTRDAFVEMLKERSAELLEAAVVASPGQPIFVTHIHDEASMRFRSFDVVDGAQTSNRAMYSKVQNNAVTVSVGPTSMEWLTELQPLALKNGATLATAMLDVMENLLVSLRAGVARRPEKTGTVVHLLIGDGVNTNENAAEKMLHYLGDAVGRGLRYRLLV